MEPADLGAARGDQLQPGGPRPGQLSAGPVWRDCRRRGATLGDLPARPALYINAFDVGNRVRFIFSKQYVDTGRFLPHGWESTSNDPEDFVSENDLSFCRIDPGSLRIADAVFASSAYPFAFPNFALNHFGGKVRYKGRYVFLADGGLADNSGLLTLFTQMRAALPERARGAYVLAVSIDASLDDSVHGGTRFQERGIEQEYAWWNTIYRQGEEALDAAITAHQDAVFKFLETCGIVTDQLALNYPLELKRKGTKPASPEYASWEAPLREGRIKTRPCVIRLGLRDLSDAYYALWPRYLNDGAPEDRRLIQLLKENGIDEKKLGPWQATGAIVQRVRSIPTDFKLRRRDRRALDLAAYLLVHGRARALLVRLVPGGPTVTRIPRGRRSGYSVSRRRGKIQSMDFVGWNQGWGLIEMIVICERSGP